MEREQAKQIVKQLSAWFPSWKVDSEVVRIWVESLEKEDFEIVSKNIQQYMKGGNEYPPSFSILIKVDAGTQKKRDPELEYRRMEIARNRWIDAGNDPNEFTYRPD